MSDWTPYDARLVRKVLQDDNLAPFSSDKIRAKILDLGYGGTFITPTDSGVRVLTTHLHACRAHSTNRSVYSVLEPDTDFWAARPAGAGCYFWAESPYLTRKRCILVYDLEELPFPLKGRFSECGLKTCVAVSVIVREAGRVGRYDAYEVELSQDSTFCRCKEAEKWNETERNFPALLRRSKVPPSDSGV